MNAKSREGQGNGQFSVLPEDVPLQLLIAQIDEDPQQPRTENNPGFSQASLQELSATIIERGVKSPISVRVNPNSPGRYLVNHGARRLRASRLAGKDTIPAFVDNDYSEFDQVVENLQRNDLTPREIADFIGRELSKGMKRGEIAKAIGKSAAFVTQHANLLDLPVPIGTAFITGRCKDVTVINELITAFRQHPEAVSDWLSDPSQEVTRSAVKLLREYLKEREGARVVQQIGQPGLSDDSARRDLIQAVDEPYHPQASLLEEHQATYGGYESGNRKERKRTVSQPIVQVLHNGRTAKLLIHRRPPSEGWGWICFEDDGHITRVELSQLKLVALIAPTSPARESE